MKQNLKKIIVILTLLLSNFSFSQVDIAGDVIYLNRFGNPSNGRHYYTTASSVGSGYIYEGNIGLISKVYSTQYNTPLYVVTKNGDRLLTISESEKNFCLTNGYVYEGILGYCQTSTDSPIAPVIIYRYYHRTLREHFYTTNYYELGGGLYGYTYEGIAWSNKLY